MDNDLGGANIDDYMNSAGYGNASNLPLEPGSMAEAGMFDEVAPQGQEMEQMEQMQQMQQKDELQRMQQLQKMTQMGGDDAPGGLLDYQRGQFGVNVPTTEAESGLPPARYGGRGGGEFAQINARNAMAIAKATMSAPAKDQHPVTIAIPTPSGVNAQRRKLQTPTNSYQGTLLDGIGSHVPSRSERLSKVEQFKAQAAKDAEVREAHRQKMIAENADGHYTKEKLVQINRKYREEAGQVGDSYTSYVDQLGNHDDATVNSDATMTMAEARLRTKKEKQEEYKLMLMEQQELKKLHDLHPPPLEKDMVGGGGGALATIGMGNPSGQMGQMTEEQRARHRAAQLKYRQDLDSQIERKKYNKQMEEKAPDAVYRARRPSNDVDVRQMREMEAAQARLQALNEIPKAEITEYEKKRLQQQKLLVQSLQNTSNNLDKRLQKPDIDRQEKREELPKGDYFSGLGEYQSELQSKECRRAAANQYKEQLQNDSTSQSIQLPRRSLRDMKRDPFAMDEMEAEKFSRSTVGMGVFTSPSKSANLPKVARGNFGSVGNGSINMAPGDMQIHQQNKLAMQARYAAQLAEDSQTMPTLSPRRSIAAMQRAQRQKENVPYWPEDMAGPGAALGNGLGMRSNNSRSSDGFDDKREKQALIRMELARDEEERRRARDSEAARYSPRSPRSRATEPEEPSYSRSSASAPGRTYAEVPKLQEHPFEPVPPGGGQPRAPNNDGSELFNSFRQSLEAPSITEEEEEDRLAIAAYEEYLRKAAAGVARARINRQAGKEELATALYDDPLAMS